MMTTPVVAFSNNKRKEKVPKIARLYIAERKIRLRKTRAESICELCIYSQRGAEHLGGVRQSHHRSGKKFEEPSKQGENREKFVRIPRRPRRERERDRGGGGRQAERQGGGRSEQGRAPRGRPCGRHARTRRGRRDTCRPPPPQPHRHDPAAAMRLKTSPRGSPPPGPGLAPSPHCRGRPLIRSPSLDPPSRPAPRLQVGDMAEDAPPQAPAPKLLYIAVADGGGRRGFRYTRPVLQSTLHLMGCKPRHAFKVPSPRFPLYSRLPAPACDLDPSFCCACLLAGSKLYFAWRANC
jgi:hypothetical protein